MLSLLQLRKIITINDRELSEIVTTLRDCANASPGSRDVGDAYKRIVEELLAARPLDSDAAFIGFEQAFQALDRKLEPSVFTRTPEVNRVVMRIAFRLFSKLVDANSPLLTGRPALLYFHLCCRLLGYVNELLQVMRLHVLQGDCKHLACRYIAVLDHTNGEVLRLRVRAVLMKMVSVLVYPRG